ncbi:MAG TPA: acyl-CoA thioester hydrolase/BAAT C-terminal domain-containing protein [Lachnospiraceae bacterium]|nr:acyl-CoA thioester hydrolase/BAAT C-terminal domain-containing protein [Lachnospiraceae bacterium]
MSVKDFTMKENGFVGHLAEPDHNLSDKAVIVIMGGEKSILPGIKIAQRFTDFGITGLAVSLFGAEGLPDGIDRIPLEMFQPAIDYLHNEKKIRSISIYGMSMGSIFAALIAKYLGGIDNIILCSPSHVPFEGTEADKQHMTGHSIATYEGKEIPYVKPDFSAGGINKYVFDAQANRNVMKMWVAYRDAYQNKELEERATLHLEETGARILLVAGTADEAWPSDYSVTYIRKQLDACGYSKDYKMLIYQNASHLIGVMPNKQQNKWLYRALPLIGLIYKSFGAHKKECTKALIDSEGEIIQWING